MSSILPKIVIEGRTSNEPFVKFTQNYEWTTSNPCLSVINGYTDLNGLLINGADNSNTFVSSINSNITFGIKGNNANFIFKNDNTELLRIVGSNGNIGIGNTNLSIYKLNINGTINSTDIFKNNTNLDNIYLKIDNNYWLKNNNNIYTNSLPSIINVGMGTSTPIANLHIYGSTNNNTVRYTNDGTLIISKIENSDTIFNFKLGYNNTNDFIFGNYIIENGKQQDTWVKQFSINSSAPENSLVINSSGNIGIGTSSSIDSYKVNIYGNLKATSLTGDGLNITNIDYNNINSNKPNLKNIDNWIFNNSGGIDYIYSIDKYVSIGSPNIPDSRYRVNITGNLNATLGIYVNGTNLTELYLSKNDATTNYLTITDADEKYYYLVQDPGTNINKIYFKNDIKFKELVLGIPNTESGTTINNNILTANGIINATAFSGKGSAITDIKYTNITDVPPFIQSNTVADLYFSKDYMNTAYHTIISNITYQISPTNTQFNKLNNDVQKIYDNAITDQLLLAIASNLKNNLISIYYSNIQNIPYYYNINNDTETDRNKSIKIFGFGKEQESGIRINVDGKIKTDELISLGKIYESNISLSNIYVSQNYLNNTLPFYDTIVQRQIAIYEYENIYPPQNTLFTDNNTIITNSPFGNGLYKVDCSIRLNPNIITSYNSIFNQNENDISLSIDNDYVPPTYIFNISANDNTNANILTINTINSINISGHWIQLYYSNMFVASKIVIIVSNINNAPKTIYVVGTQESNISLQTTSSDWVILLNNYTIPNDSYIQSGSIYTAIIPLPSNITHYYYYRVIITQINSPVITGNTNILKIKQIKFYGYEKKQEWRNSGSNIYSYSNISIKTIDNNSPYALNVNGIIYSSNNIYASNIGIGTTNPIGNLHIGSITNSSDGTIIIAKHNGITGRILKMGYDSSFNFIIGDYGSSGTLNWKPQFYINSNAPENSLIINSFGNIGIGTTIHTDISGNTYKLSINGSTNIIGSLNQEGLNLNKFKGDIYASNNVSIISNLNAWKVYASNIRTTDYINSYGVISSFSNIGIGTSTSLLGSLHIQTIPNNIGIWNSSSNLSIGNTLKNFIGSNSLYGFYNNYNYNHLTDYNKNYISWTTPNNNIDVFNITNSGNIGIGTTIPEGILQVDNGNKFFISSNNDNKAIIGLNTNDSINTKIHLIGSDKSINYYASNHIYYNFEKNEKIRIDNNGNIGIGTTILSDISGNTYKLSINGSIYSSNKIDVFNSISIGSINNDSDGNLTISKKTASINNSFKFGYDSIKQHFIMGNIITNEWKNQFTINTLAPNNSLYINSDGRIGINNLNPEGTLHIGSKTDINNNSGSIVISQKTDNINSSSFKIGYNDNYDFVFGDSNIQWKQQFYINSNAPENSLIINRDGNIGIGTINTNTYKLAINGSIIQYGNGTNNLFRGNVGIATDINNLDYNFNVNGTAYISNGITTTYLSNVGEIIQKGIVKIGPSVDRPTDYGYNFYVNHSTCIDAPIDIKGIFNHSGNQFILNSSRILINSNITINGLLNLNSNLGINITSNILTNVLQVEDGGKLRISNNRNDYTCIGTSNIDNTTNTRIIINGEQKSGNIEHYATSTGKHIFYSGGGLTELMRLESNGPIKMTNELYVASNIKENNNYLSDIYVKLDQLSNLSVNNYNLNKKYGYTSTTTTPNITINGDTYYKFDIDLSSLKTISLQPLSSFPVKYRIFNIKCFMNNGIFEMNNNIIPSILQYDIYMSNGQINHVNIDPSTYTNNSIHINAIGRPENYKLNNLLPCHITLLRTSDFNYLSIISKIPNLSVSYIIEDYLG